MKKVLFLLFLSNCFSVFAAANYNNLSYAHVIEKNILTRAIQSMITSTYRIGFKQLDRYDFYHGHLVFEKGAELPFSILFHTQEELEARFDVNSRNWLTYLNEDFKSENAWPLRYNISTHPAPQYDHSYTIVHSLLDPEKLGRTIETKGIKGYSIEYQVAFRPITCKSDIEFIEEKSTYFEVFLPAVSQTRVCLELGTCVNGWCIF